MPRMTQEQIDKLDRDIAKSGELCAEVPFTLVERQWNMITHEEALESVNNLLEKDSKAYKLAMSILDRLK